VSCGEAIREVDGWRALFSHGDLMEARMMMELLQSKETDECECERECEEKHAGKRDQPNDDGVIFELTSD
jgi:hypothetical protein